MLTLFNYFKYILIFFNVHVALKANEISSIKSNHDNVKEYISKWWKQTSHPNPVKCIEDKDSTETKLKVLDYLERPRIRAFTCNKGTTPTQYLFIGLNKTHYPDGAGKLKAIEKSEWLHWSEAKRSNFTARNVYALYRK